MAFVGEARRRRDLFKSADVDVIIVFDQDRHPEWGMPGGSAAEALDHTRRCWELRTELLTEPYSYSKGHRIDAGRSHIMKDPRSSEGSSFSQVSGSFFASPGSVQGVIEASEKHRGGIYAPPSSEQPSAWQLSAHLPACVGVRAGRSSICRRRV
jgi:hypothetical protein